MRVPPCSCDGGILKRRRRCDGGEGSVSDGEGGGGMVWLVDEFLFC